ncbi:hypothetical protein [Vibrio chagasii]|uniref:hypothetical protein n=1 Tax=Vibrio chagasii TaxID=170679 RepID=UPI00397ED183
MESQFVNNMTRALAQSFFYCPENGSPTIQVGGASSFTFWLRYDDEAINRCASDLIKELGSNLGINDIDSSKSLLLDFSSHAFSQLGADFSAINMTELCVDNILSDLHRSDMSILFDDYVTLKQKKYPYTYTFQCTNLRGTVRLNDDMYLYGSGEVERLIKDINSITGVNFPHKFLDEEYPICRYARLPHTSLVLVYARSKVEAEELFNRLFGALCITVDSPFLINQMSVDDRINIFSQNSLCSGSIRVNLPSLYELNINERVIEKLEGIFHAPSKRMNSALSFVAHGWTHDERERFLNHFIALDSLYGRGGGGDGNRRSIVHGVSRDAATIDNISSKIQIIYELRSKFVHGDITSFSSHGRYLNFVDKHGVDPLSSLFEILVQCVLNYDNACRK